MKNPALKSYNMENDKTQEIAYKLKNELNKEEGKKKC